MGAGRLHANGKMAFCVAPYSEMKQNCARRIADQGTLGSAVHYEAARGVCAHNRLMRALLRRVPGDFEIDRVWVETTTNATDHSGLRLIGWGAFGCREVPADADLTIMPLRLGFHPIPLEETRYAIKGTAMDVRYLRSDRAKWLRRS